MFNHSAIILPNCRVCDKPNFIIGPQPVYPKHCLCYTIMCYPYNMYEKVSTSQGSELNKEEEEEVEKNT